MCVYTCMCGERKSTKKLQAQFSYAVDCYNSHLSLSQHGQVLTECSRMLLNVPVVLPSYFFIALQRTTVKVHVHTCMHKPQLSYHNSMVDCKISYMQLALSPPLPSPGQQITVHLNTHLSLKVEGVIEHSGNASEQPIHTMSCHVFHFSYCT